MKSPRDSDVPGRGDFWICDVNKPLWLKKAANVKKGATQAVNGSGGETDGFSPAAPSLSLLSAPSPTAAAGEGAAAEPAGPVATPT
jgi:hypothetical protein